MSHYLFNEFNEVSAKEWKQKIQADLKGADYNDTLVWKNLEGIDVKPFYHLDETDTNHYSIEVKNPNDWNIAQTIFINNESISNHFILNAIERGAECVLLKADKEFDIPSTFKDFPFEKASIYFNFSFLSELFITNLIDFFSNKNSLVYYNLDPIGNLSRTGNWFRNLNEDFEILRKIKNQKTQENIVAIDGSLYQNSGANIIQQLAYSLAHANEYLNYFKDSNLSDFKITFKLSVGSNYFFEIAKIRALRILYETLAKEYGISETCHITTMPSHRNKTIYDYNINMLRTTTEYMSAIIGGSNTICSDAYDSIYHKNNEFGERIARNQLLILREESYFKASNNPAKGSYYIEYLTKQLSEKALILFKNIEASGGFLSQLKKGIIQKKIKETASKEQDLFNSGKLILLGTNIHQNQEDQMKDNLELYPFSKSNPRKTLIEPILERRLSEINEQERLKKENKDEKI